MDTESALANLYGKAKMSDAKADLAESIFIEGFPKLDDRAKKLFTEVIQVLQSHSYLLRGGSIRVDPRYFFCEKHEDLVNAYLSLGGWRLQLDREKGVARLYHPESRGRVRFNKFETTLILVLRILYHEQKRVVTESLDPIITIGAIREKLHALLPAQGVRPFLSKKLMGGALKNLERFQILTFESSSFLLDDDSKIKLYPVLEYFVTHSTLEALEQRIKVLHDSTSQDEPEKQGEEQEEEEATL